MKSTFRFTRATVSSLVREDAVREGARRAGRTGRFFFIGSSDQCWNGVGTDAQGHDRQLHFQKQGILRFTGIHSIVRAHPSASALMPEDIILRTSNLGKRYGRRWAVRDLDIAVRRGEIFGFLGPNGAGKSTTIRMMLSLVRPTAGETELFGLSLRKHRSEVLSRVGGMVESADFYLYLTARRNLEIVAALRGGAPRREIDRVLETVGLLDRAGEKVKAFSHGMRQRLGIAQALIGGPELVVLDEPTTGLDPQGIREVRDLLRTLCSGAGLTVFLSSHLLSEIEQTATSMAVISEGKLVAQGGVRELLDGGENVVRIEASPPEAAMAIASRQAYAGSVTKEGNMIRVTMPGEKVADLNRALVEGGVAVSALTPRRSLEDYFLSITEGATEVTRRRGR
ncbi:MAG: ABC transporter ATP-binding protein [Bacteroidota bacterium]